MRSDPSPNPSDQAPNLRPALLRPDPSGLRAAATRLRAGRPVAIPTETVYGLAARAGDPDAVRRVFALKGRPADHPLIVHLPSASALSDWTAGEDARAHALAERFWPGPLTLIRPAAAGVPSVVTGGHPTVAVRVPGHPVARALLAELGEAVAAPSANRFGRLSPTRAEHVAAEFPDADLWILDGGPCPIGLESTIVDLTGPRVRIVRPGAVGAEALADALGEACVEGGAEADGRGGARADAPVASPGTLASHYAPDADLRLLDASDIVAAAAALPDAAMLLVRAAPPAGHRGAVRRAPKDPAGYARGLYHALRALDATRPPAVLVERPPERNEWRAVHDRLGKAAAPRPRAPRAFPARKEPV